MNDNPNATIGSFHPAAEHAIALAAKRGDERAFGILFERYQREIFGVAVRYTRVRQDAEDVVQQTFQKAFIHLHAFEGKSSFGTWLTRIAINEALMLLRRGRALREVPIDDSSEDEAPTHALEIHDSGPDPEAKYLKREEAEALATAIKKLTVGVRTAIELQGLAELSTQETARRMGVSVAAAKARIFQGRRKLQKILRSVGITPEGAQPLTVARLADRSCSSVALRIAGNREESCHQMRAVWPSRLERPKKEKGNVDGTDWKEKYDMAKVSKLEGKVRSCTGPGVRRVLRDVRTRGANQLYARN